MSELEMARKHGAALEREQQSKNGVGSSAAHASPKGVDLMAGLRAGQTKEWRY
ncbi:hypothetical protein [Nonomuraea candida]|uniref:hypothetical protein n=1 Tax=Nonomuraea candida TaxID=359159 RepID=UPI000AC792A8|nr:hypothetical protein [Nonomuraea candida]